MKVLVDTSIWSLALRRHQVNDDDPLLRELKELISEVRVEIIGPIRQEILSGISNDQQFSRLRQYLAAFPDLPLASQVFETAAQFYNTARSKGIQGSNTDFLIFAVASEHRLPIYTSDNDFKHFTTFLPIDLHLSRFND